MRAVATILIHPNPLFAEGLRRILSGTRFRLSGIAASAGELPVRSWRKAGDLFFIVGGDDRAGAAENVRAIRGRHREAKIVVLGACRGLDDVLSALDAGATSYLRSTIRSDALIKALELTLHETVLPSEFVKHLRERGSPRDEAALDPQIEPKPAAPRWPPLTETVSPQSGGGVSARQAAILRCLKAGASNKIIARELDMAEATVKVHLKAILRKIRVNNRTQAAIWAMNHLPDGSEPLLAKEPAAPAVGDAVGVPAPIMKNARPETSARAANTATLLRRLRITA